MMPPIGPSRFFPDFPHDTCRPWACEASHCSQHGSPPKGSKSSILLMAITFGDHQPGCMKPFVNNGIDYQAQLVSLPEISAINSMKCIAGTSIICQSKVFPSYVLTSDVAPSICSTTLSADPKTDQRISKIILRPKT